MNIGIVTFNCAVNAGAYVQQLALSRVLEDLGYEVEILRYRSSFSHNELRSRFYSNKGLRRLTSVIEVFRFWRKTFGDFSYSPRASVRSSFDWSRYSTVVFGSDEIWNVKNW